MALVLLFPFLFMAPKPGIQIQPRSSILEKMPMIFGKRGVPVFSSQLELSSSRLSQLQDSVESAADYQASQLSDENKDESNEDLDLRPHTGAVMRSTSDYQRLCVKLSDLLMIFLSICGKDSGGITSDGRSEKGENPAAADSEELTDGASSPASDQDWLDAGGTGEGYVKRKSVLGRMPSFFGKRNVEKTYRKDRVSRMPMLFGKRSDEGTHHSIHNNHDKSAEEAQIYLYNLANLMRGARTNDGR